MNNNKKQTILDEVGIEIKLVILSIKIINSEINPNKRINFTDVLKSICIKFKKYCSYDFSNSIPKCYATT